VIEQAQSLSGRSLDAAMGFSFEIRVEPAGAAWELVLVTRTSEDAEKRERRLRGASCSEVSDAAAVAIAMTLGGRDEPTDSVAASTAVPDETAPVEPNPPQTPRTPPVESRPRTPAAGDGQGLEGVAALHALVDSGTLPSVAFGFDVGFGVRWRKLGAIVEGGYLFPNHVELDGGRGGSFELRYGALLVCFMQPFGPVAGSGCTGYEVGSLSGEGEGVAAPRLESALWQAVRLELGLGVPLAPALRATFALGAAVAVDPPEFVLDEGEVVHRPETVAMRGRAGLEFLFQ
jgi:hypothetical protein